MSLLVVKDNIVAALPTSILIDAACIKAYTSHALNS